MEDRSISVIIIGVFAIISILIPISYDIYFETDLEIGYIIGVFFLSIVVSVAMELISVYAKRESKEKSRSWIGYGLMGLILGPFLGGLLAGIILPGFWIIPDITEVKDSMVVAYSVGFIAPSLIVMMDIYYHEYHNTEGENCNMDS